MLKNLFADDRKPPPPPKKEVPDTGNFSLSSLFTPVRREGNGVASATKQQKTLASPISKKPLRDAIHKQKQARVAKKPQTLEPECKARLYKRSVREFVCELIDATKFKSHKQGTKVSRWMEENENEVYMYLNNNFKMQEDKFFKEESKDAFRTLAIEFIKKSEFSMKLSTGVEDFSLAKALKQKKVELESLVAINFEELVAHGLVQLDMDCKCPNGCCDKKMAFCDYEDGDHVYCNKPVCTLCTKQVEGFEVDDDTHACFCEVHMNDMNRAEMDEIVRVRTLYNKRKAKLAMLEDIREERLQTFKKKETSARYADGRIDKGEAFEKLGLDRKTKRALTLDELERICIVYGPDHDRKKKINPDPVPKVAPTIKFNKKKMNGAAVQEKLKVMLTEAEDELNKHSTDLPKIEKMLNTAHDFFIKGRSTLSKEDLDSLNQDMRKREDSLYEKINPPEAGVAEESDDDEKYGSGIEDNPESDDDPEGRDINLLDTLMRDSDVEEYA